MNKEAIISFVKKNMTSLICGTLALIAVGLLFYPIGGWFEALQSAATDRSNLQTQLTSYQKQRKLPISDPQAAEPGPLNGMPNKPTIALGNAAIAKFKAVSEKSLKDVSQLNQQGHTVLVPGLLALGPREVPRQTAFFDFAACYKQVLSTDPAVQRASDPVLQKFDRQNIQNDILNGALPPTDADIGTARSALWTDQYQPMTIYKDGKPINDQDLRSKWAVEAKALNKKMMGAVATKHKVYVEHDAFTIDPLIKGDEAAPITEIWYAQVQVWVQQDLAYGIAEANAKASNILDAEVKRLIKMDVPPQPMYVFPPASAAGGGGGPGGTGIGASPADEKTVIPPIFTVSDTGRYSNGMYDVVPFHLIVDVDASRVNEFIQTLQRNRLITITNETTYAVNSEFEAAKPRYFLYGAGSVVRLVLDGEELYLRDWTARLMPEGVKVNLGLIQGKPAAGGGPVGPGPGGPGGPMGMPGMR